MGKIGMVILFMNLDVIYVIIEIDNCGGGFYCLVD